MSTDSNQPGEFYREGVAPKIDGSPKTVAERTRFLIKMIRNAYHRRPRGIRGAVYVADLFLIYMPGVALRLYLRVFLIWPFARLRARIVVTWIQVQRSASLAFHRTRVAKDNRSPLDRTLARSVCMGNIHNVAILLKRGANPSGTLKTRTPLLLFAVRTRKHEIVKLLLEAGASADARDLASKTPAIWYAASKSDIGVVQMLLQYGANVDAHGVGGLTALMEAARSGDTEMVRLLLAAGADPSKRDLCGFTACDWAVDKRQEHIVKLLAAQNTTKV